MSVGGNLCPQADSLESENVVENIAFRVTNQAIPLQPLPRGSVTTEIPIHLPNCSNIPITLRMTTASQPVLRRKTRRRPSTRPPPLQLISELRNVVMTIYTRIHEEHGGVTSGRTADLSFSKTIPSGRYTLGSGDKQGAGFEFRRLRGGRSRKKAPRICGRTYNWQSLLNSMGEIRPRWRGLRVAFATINSQYGQPFCIN